VKKKEKNPRKTSKIEKLPDSEKQNENKQIEKKQQIESDEEITFIPLDIPQAKKAIASEQWKNYGFKDAIPFYLQKGNWLKKMYDSPQHNVIILVDNPGYGKTTSPIAMASLYKDVRLIHLETESSVFENFDKFLEQNLFANNKEQVTYEEYNKQFKIEWNALLYHVFNKAKGIFSEDPSRRILSMPLCEDKLNSYIEPTYGASFETILDKNEKNDKFKVFFHIDEIQRWAISSEEAKDKYPKDGKEKTTFIKKSEFSAIHQHWKVRNLTNHAAGSKGTYYLILTGTNLMIGQQIRADSDLKDYSFSKIPQLTPEDIKALLKKFLPNMAITEDQLQQLTGPPRILQYFLMDSFEQPVNLIDVNGVLKSTKKKNGN